MAKDRQAPAVRQSLQEQVAQLQAEQLAFHKAVVDRLFSIVEAMVGKRPPSPAEGRESAAPTETIIGMPPGMRAKGVTHGRQLTPQKS